MIKNIFLIIALLFAVNSYAEKVNKIVIEGLQRVEESTIYSYLGFAKEDMVSSQKIDDATKKLFQTGLFEDIKISSQNGVVHIKVVENPMIHTLSLEGNKRVKTDDIIKELTQTSRSILNKSKVQIDVETIKRLYQRNSRYAAKVDTKIIKLPHNRVNLIYEINEGPKTLISKIYFIGNNNVSGGKLKDVILTREDKWFRFLTDSPKFDPEKVKFDRELLVDFYTSRGFADIEIEDPVIDLSTESNSFVVTFIIKEGEIYNFRNITVDNKLKNIETKEVESLIGIKPKKRYNSQLIRQDVEVINNLLANKGYPFSTAEVSLDKHPEARLVDVKYVIDEGPKFYINQINIKGNLRTVDKVIRREFKIAEGDPYHAKQIQKAEKRLKDLDFFDPVTVRPSHSEKADDRVDVDVEVKEKSTGSLNFAAGVSSIQGPIGKIGYQERNLAGRGYEIDTYLMKARRDTDFKASFTNPYFYDYDLAVGIDVERVLHDKSKKLDRNYSQQTNMIAGRASYEIIENLRYGTFYRYKVDEYKDIEQTSSLLLREDNAKKIISSIGHSLSWDSLDSKQYPTKGLLVKFVQDLAGIFKGSQFFRNEFKASFYKPVIRQDVVLLLQFGAGHIQSLGHSKIPISERFYMGGDDVRAFRTNGIGPRDSTTGEAVGGNTFYNARAQLSVPLGLPKELDIRGLIFADAGGLFGVDYKNYSDPAYIKSVIFNSKNPRAAIGTGIAWHSPIGLIGITVAKPISKQSFDKEKILRFSIMSEF
ncbi:outer membrane protein assembly factor BamA [Rickettsiales endosymbiont of Stachyamoeba lipophora]|uniref:outer membrane protein assembly factor BamA n=1 Tax=Rickettsiales endosymbiont of Stachyamoeba lipophora TaxID=2486578 RepID=UPI000F6478D7|nr:outer membrane protein assembly factor BamA [Rickettsiales endosymbiont of Stachyamoeba lipophora]AZL15776.1 outer membrane protein assembly factor BamA [Rickettsiales endosymbiont of Stachyamoeba lipophora]